MLIYIMEYEGLCLLSQMWTLRIYVFMISRFEPPQNMNMNITLMRVLCQHAPQTISCKLCQKKKTQNGHNIRGGTTNITNINVSMLPCNF